MTPNASKTLVVAVVAVAAGVLLAGCRSAPRVDYPTVEPTPSVRPSRPPAVVEERRPVSRADREGNPLDSTGQPLGRVFYFEFDQARLSERDLRTLAVHAAYLRDFRDRQVFIEGHCDERGTREYNLALGERRAQAVQRYLVSAGVRAGQLQTISYGEERPEDAGNDERAWARNRRAVMVYR